MGGGHKYLTELSLGHGLTSCNIIMPTEKSHTLHKIFQSSYFYQCKSGREDQKELKHYLCWENSAQRPQGKNVLQFVSLQNGLTNTVKIIQFAFGFKKINTHKQQRLYFSSAYCNLVAFLSINCRAKAVCIPQYIPDNPEL